MGSYFFNLSDPLSITSMQRGMYMNAYEAVMLILAVVGISLAIVSIMKR